MPYAFQRPCEGGLRRLLVAAIVLISCIDTLPCFSQSPAAETADARPTEPVRTFQKFTSKNFVIHTDFKEQDAREMLERLEKTLARVSRYWGRRPRKKIECYVVKDFKNWNDSDFPHAFARALISGVGGGVYTESEPGRRSSPEVTVYASSRLGVVEHESVHAYCVQTFGSSGPDWYKEGMAEMAFHGRTGKMEVECNEKIIDYLRRSRRPSIQQITHSGRMNQDLSESLLKMLSAFSSDSLEQRDESISQWRRDYGKSVQASREAYRWCWALCHFMSHNPNYAKRFRQLGNSYLTRNKQNRQVLFQNLLGSMQREIEFEYRFFLDRIGIGYRVDLCHWDWKSKFRTIDPGDSKSSRIRAAFGYQPSGLIVQKGRRYSFECTGTWQIEHEGNALDADGNKQGLGRLEGIVMTDYELSEPFDLGQNGTFKAPAEGKLFLRCRDRWTELGDNKGSVLVKISNRTSAAAE